MVEKLARDLGGLRPRRKKSPEVSAEVSIWAQAVRLIDGVEHEVGVRPLTRGSQP